jgi:hypothetical protein
MNKPLLDPVEVSRARVGPRERKDPRSREYAIQTLYALKRYAESLKCDRDRVQTELQRIEEFRHWEILGYESIEAMLAAEVSVPGLENIKLTLRERAAVDIVRTPAAGPESGGRPRKLSEKLSIATSSTSAARIAARLKRDHPAIAEAVERGEYRSMRSAGIAAGIVRVPSAYDVLVKAWQKADESDRQQFLAYIET